MYVTRTDKASTHTFYGPDDVWQRYKALCPLKLEGKPASKRVAELVERDLKELEGAPEPDKTEENIGELQSRLLEIETELDKTKRVLNKNNEISFNRFCLCFHMIGEYPLFQKETGMGRIVNGRRQLARFIRDTPLKDEPPEVVQLGIRVVELRIERQEVTDKLRVLQCQKYGLPLPGSEEEKKMLQEKAEQKKREKEEKDRDSKEEVEIEHRLWVLELGAKQAELAEAVADAEYPTCPTCGEKPQEAADNGLPEVQCRKCHVWSLVEGCLGEDEY
jgi:hypothetical protein